MSMVPSNVSQLDPILQKLIKDDITLKENEMKQANTGLQKVLLDTMQNKMKIIDETFKTLYKQPHFVGSYYENLRVGQPSEFDINLELQLPIAESDIEIETGHTEPGFTKIKVGKNFRANTSENVIKKIESWLENGYLCRDSVIQWLQGVVDKVLTTEEWPQDMTVNRIMCGPAVTLIIRKNDMEYSLDLVPIFTFGKSRLPEEPLLQVNNLGNAISEHLKWCIVPKSPRNDSTSRHQWRMSFYMYEKELTNDQKNMKPVVKLMKMLGRLEDHLQKGNIPFFWDKRSNLIGHLNKSQIQNICGRVTNLKKKLEQAISSNDERNIASAVGSFYSA